MIVHARLGLLLVGLIAALALAAWRLERAAARPRVEPAPRQTWFVAPDGSDASGNGGPSAPWATIDHATSRMRPGDLLYLRGGTYRRASVVRSSGRSGAPLTILAWPGETPLLVAPPTSPGSDVDTLRILGSHVSVQNLRITNENDPGQAVWIGGSATGVSVEGCELFGARGQGILVSGSGNRVASNRVHGNGVHAALDHGVYLEGSGNTVRDNLIHGNWTFGVQVYRGAPPAGSGNVVEGNFIYDNGRGAAAAAAGESGGIVVAGYQNAVTIRGNRICGNAGVGILVLDDSSSNVFGTNVTCYNPRGGAALRAPGDRNAVAHLVSFNDGGAALEANPRGKKFSSDYNTFFRTSSAPSLVWRQVPYDLAGFRAASGHDAHSAVADPRFVHLPTDGFNPVDAESYDFCNALEPSFCTES